MADNANENGVVSDKDKFSKYMQIKKSSIDCYRGAIEICFLLFLGAAIALVIIAIQKFQAEQTCSDDRTVCEAEKKKLRQDEVCLTDGCVQAAARISSAIDSRINPCDNFYEYACASWEKKRMIPDDKAIVDNFFGLYESVLMNLNELLSRDVSQTEPDALRKAKEAHVSCMDKDAIEKIDNQAAVDYVNAMGGWPVLDQTWTDTGFNLEELLIKQTHYKFENDITRYNSQPLLSVGVATNDKEPGENILHAYQPKLGMPDRAYYLDAEHASKLEAYRQLAVDMATLMGADRNTADAQMFQMVEFEKRLANISRPPADLYDAESTFHQMTIRDLDQNFSIPYLNWRTFISGIFSEVNVTINDTEPIVMLTPSPSEDYIASLPPLINSQLKRTIVNYIIWRGLLGRIQQMNKEARGYYQTYSQEILGNTVEKARWQYCTELIADNMGDAVGRLYIDENFSKDSKRSALKLVGHLKATFNDIIDELDWMDNGTKNVAKEKAAAVGTEIGYDDRVLDNDHLNRTLEDVTINATAFFANMLSISKARFLHSARKLHQAVDMKEWPWPFNPALTDAAYMPQKNIMYFPAGILIPLFFKRDQLQALNFGGIGMVIGHELTHGFDSIGRHYDKTGKLTSWWSEEAVTKFRQKSQCFINRYSNYTIPEAPGMKVNGDLTLAENIADVGGLKASFMAYKKWVAATGTQERKLPGLSSTPDQLFFINFAQIWCAKMRPAEAERRILTDPHSPPRIRTIGSVQNSEEFAETFKCKEGSRMNPEVKCGIW